MSWAKYPTLTSLNQNYLSLPLCLPHTRWIIEVAFGEWQQLTALETGGSQIAESSKSLITNTRSDKVRTHSIGDAKQPFRAEKRYRRR